MLQTADLHPHTSSALPVLDLETAAAQLREQAQWKTHGHAAATLVREPDLRVVLVELRAGAHMQEHRTVARVSIHALRGRVLLRVGDRTVTLAAGQILILDGNVAHDVRAEVDSALLITIAWHAAEDTPGRWLL